MINKYTEVDREEIVHYSFSASEDDVIIEDGDEDKMVEVVSKERRLWGKVYKSKMSYADAKRYRSNMSDTYHISIYDKWEGDNT